MFKCRSRYESNSLQADDNLQVLGSNELAIIIGGSRCELCETIMNTKYGNWRPAAALIWR